MKAIAYIRVSTEEQAQSGLGLEAQRDRINAYATMKGVELVDVIADPAVSGAKHLAARPGGAELLKALKARQASIVIVLKLDRAFRNAADCLCTTEQWERKGITLHIVDLGGNAIDSSSAAGKFMLTVLAGAAEMERNMTCERTRAAMAVKRARGERVSRYAPFGFDFGPEGDLVANAREQGLISELRARREDGSSFSSIARDLNAQGTHAKQGGLWHAKTVRDVIEKARKVLCPPPIGQMIPAACSVNSSM